MVSRLITIEGKVKWRAAKSRSSNAWIGECRELNLSMEADSLDELHSLIPETMHLLLVDLMEDGEMDAYLQERGWSLVNSSGSDDETEFEVPFELIAEGTRGSERRAH